MWIETCEFSKQIKNGCRKQSYSVIPPDEDHQNYLFCQIKKNLGRIIWTLRFNKQFRKRSKNSHRQRAYFLKTCYNEFVLEETAAFLNFFSGSRPYFFFVSNEISLLLLSCSNMNISRSVFLLFSLCCLLLFRILFMYVGCFLYYVVCRDQRWWKIQRDLEVPNWNYLRIIFVNFIT